MISRKNRNIGFTKKKLDFKEKDVILISRKRVHTLDFPEFHATQILREMNVRDSRSAKTAILSFRSAVNIEKTLSRNFQTVFTKDLQIVPNFLCYLFSRIFFFVKVGKSLLIPYQNFYEIIKLCKNVQFLHSRVRPIFSF